MTSIKPQLTVINGDREALELEALLSVPYDFEKTKRIFKQLMQRAETPLVCVSVVKKEEQDDDSNL
jgi:hypothetical protein